MNFLTAEEVESVSRRTVAILQDKGLTCCLMGSAATSLYGAIRTPNDVDVVVMPAYSQEEVKRILVNADSNFYLVASTNRRATYKVLWCRVPGNFQDCKVDILVPPTLDIPIVAVNRIPIVRGIPVMPLFPLLLLKLRGWEDHKDAPWRRTDMKAKQHVDVKDINELLGIVLRKGVTDEDRGWLPRQFLNEGKRRAQAYALAFPSSRNSWEQLGILQKQVYSFLY
ncbi:hypothetical protein OF83DRAFT_1051126 [Amylostereum chailletii]|nr:hypothetical protein OF83DRAFT_1051126 [Amylostereum chailletii]